MTRNFNLTLALVLLSSGILGCNSANKEQELQQQKLLLELSKANTERLAELTKKEQDLAALERKVQDTLDEIKQREESLQKREGEIARQEQSLQNEKDQLRATDLRHQQAEQAIAIRQKELDGMIAQYRHREEVAENARRAESDRKKAAVGMGEKGRSYGNNLIAVAAASLWSTKERLALMQIEHDMNIYKGLHGDFPKTHEEFMKNIIEENHIKLPVLHEGQKYEYDPETETLMIRKPFNKDEP
jgi:DNA repair exonuclease SbcCD ATPase subunit